MEFTDLTPEALDRLEAKLAAELDTVRRMKALLLEHFAPRSPVGAASVTGPVAAGGVPGISPAAPESGVPVLPTPAVVAAPRKDLKTRVLETVEELGKPFRMRDLERRLRGFGERSTLRSALMRLVADGEIVILQKDPGRTGSLYQRKPSPLPAAGEMAGPVAEAAENGSPPSDSLAGP